MRDKRLDAAVSSGRHHHGPGQWQDDAPGREPGLRVRSESAGPHRVLAGQEEEGPRAPGHWPPPSPHRASWSRWSRRLSATAAPSSARVCGNLKPGLRSPAPRPNWVNHLNFVERLTNVSRVQKAELLTTVWIFNTFYILWDRTLHCVVKILQFQLEYERRPAEHDLRDDRLHTRGLGRAPRSYRSSNTAAGEEKELYLIIWIMKWRALKSPDVCRLVFVEMTRGLGSWDN